MLPSIWTSLKTNTTREGTISGDIVGCACLCRLQMGPFIIKQAEPPLKQAILTVLSPVVFLRWNQDSNSTICLLKICPKHVNKLGIYLGENGLFKRSMLEAIIVSNKAKSDHLVSV